MRAAPRAKYIGRRPLPDPTPVPDMLRALAIYQHRWLSIPADERQAIVAEQATIRKELRHGRNPHPQVA